MASNVHAVKDVYGERVECLDEQLIPAGCSDGPVEADVFLYAKVARRVRLIQLFESLVNCGDVFVCPALRGQGCSLALKPDTEFEATHQVRDASDWRQTQELTPRLTLHVRTGPTPGIRQTIARTEL